MKKSLFLLLLPCIAACSTTRVRTESVPSGRIEDNSHWSDVYDAEVLAPPNVENPKIELQLTGTWIIDRREKVETFETTDEGKLPTDTTIYLLLFWPLYNVEDSDYEWTEGERVSQGATFKTEGSEMKKPAADMTLEAVFSSRGNRLQKTPLTTDAEGKVTIDLGYHVNTALTDELKVELAAASKDGERVMVWERVYTREDF